MILSLGYKLRSLLFQRMSRLYQWKIEAISAATPRVPVDV